MYIPNPNLVPKPQPKAKGDAKAKCRQEWKRRMKE
jgi:hypothetical protein